MTLTAAGAPRFVKSSQSAASPLAATGDALWSDHFGVVGAPNASTLQAVAVSGVNIYIGGSFTTVAADSGIRFNNIAWWNGSGWHPLGSGATAGVDALVRTIAVSGSNVYAGGDFTSAGGIAASRVAKWDGAGWTGLGSGMSNVAGVTLRVYALAVSGSTLYAGGVFDDAGGIAVHSIAAWNGTSWAALAGGVQTCSAFTSPGVCFQTPTSGQVNALVVSGTSLYVGGVFNLAGPGPVTSIARWAGGAWSPIGGSNVQRSGGPGTVNALTMGGTTLYAAGVFDTIGGVPAASVAAWNGTQWSALGTGANFCCGPATVSALAYRSGRLYMSGSFDGAGGDNVPGLGQWNGTAWSAVGAGLDGGSGLAPTALAVSLVSPVGVVAVGGFSRSPGTATLNHIGLWTGTRWTGYGLGASMGGSSGSIRTAAASNHNLYAGGAFSTAGAQPAVNLAHFNGTTWDAMGGGVSGGLAQPDAIAISGSNIYVGGNFAQAGAVAATNIAMWDGTSWHPLVDAATAGNGLDGAVGALLVYNGKLWVGGSFSHAGSHPAHELATWDLSAHTWASVGGNLNFDFGAVNALAGLAAPNNHFVVVGGSFPQVDDGINPRVTVNGVVLFDTSATIVNPNSGYSVLPGSGTTVGVTTCSGSCPGEVDAIGVDGTKVYLGGRFDVVGSIPSHSVARYDLSASAPAGWSSPGVVGGGSRVNAITKVGASFYLAGDFTSAGGVAAPGVAQYTPTGATTGTWAGLGSGLGSTSVLSGGALAQSADGLYVGGFLGLAGGMGAQNIALWTATKFPLTVTQTAAPAHPVLSAPIAFTGTVTNSAPTGATGVTLTSRVTSSATISAVTPSQGSCTNTATTVTCSLGALAAGAQATVAIQVTPATTGTLTSTLTVRQAGSVYSNAATTSVNVRAG